MVKIFAIRPKTMIKYYGRGFSFLRNRIWIILNFFSLACSRMNYQLDLLAGYFFLWYCLILVRSSINYSTCTLSLSRATGVVKSHLAKSFSLKILTWTTIRKCLQQYRLEEATTSGPQHLTNSPSSSTQSWALQNEVFFRLERHREFKMMLQ